MTATDFENGEIFDDGSPLDTEDYPQTAMARMHRQASQIYDWQCEVDCWIKATEQRLRLLAIAATAIELKVKCESPIEVEFGAELMAKIPHGYQVYPQFPWHGFRMDFAISSDGRVCAFIECDGAEFHSTPEQLTRDDRKNRAVEKAGIRLFRFTGSQIFRAAKTCADQVWRTIL